MRRYSEADTDSRRIHLTAVASELVSDVIASDVSTSPSHVNVANVAHKVRRYSDSAVDWLFTLVKLATPGYMLS